MKRVILCLVIGFAFHLSAYAQPSFTITDANPNPGDNFTLDVSVRDFTDILSVEYTLRWDPAVMTYVGINNLNLIDLDLGDFDVTNTVDGYITLMWAKGEDPNACADANAEGVTIDDDEIIFSVEFQAVGVYGDFTQLFIDSDPVPVRVTRKFTPNPLCNNIQIDTDNTKPGNVSIGVRPFTLSASNETANSGDVVCVDFSVTGWDDLTLLQTTVGWDPALLSLNQVIPSEDIENLSQASFNQNADPGCLPLSWFYTVPSGEGITVPDGTVMFTACFDVMAPCETEAEVFFKEEPTSTEVRNVIVLNFDLTTILNPGTVTTNDCAPTGLDLTIDCGGPFELNDNFCVPIRAGDNFADVSDMAFQVNWNEGILQYNSIVPGATFTPDIDFNTSNTENGVLGVSWESAISIFNQDLNPNDILFEICFDVVGIAGDSPINIPTVQDTVRINNGGNIGVNPTNCLVDITPPDGVIMTVAEAEAPQGDNFCVDLTISNFTDILSYQFSLNWDVNNFSFTGFTLAPEIATAAVIDLGPTGIIAIDWDGGGTPLTLNDGDVIATLCFDAVGPALTCDLSEITGIPLEAEAISTTSNGNNIGVTGQVNEWCILSPNGFILVIPDTLAPVGDTICLPIEVVGFTDILDMDFTISFNSTGLDFVEIGPAFGIPGLDINDITVNEGVGTVNVNWSDLSGTGVTVADSTVMFEVCFQAIGEPDTCEPLGLNNGATVTTLIGPGSVVPNNGEVCIQNNIVITDVRVTNVDCPGNNNGRIEIDFEGGSNNGGSVVFDWVDLIPQQFGDTIQNLAAGDYTVNYFDANDPTIGGSLTITVEVEPGAPVADAGPDVERLCCPQFNILSGTGSSQGNEFSYAWYFGSEIIDPVTQQPTGEYGLGTFLSPNVNVPVPCAETEDGTVYVIVVTNLITNCSTQDEVEILPAELPTAEAGNPQPFSCDGDITFTGMGSTPSGGSVSYSWEVEPWIDPGMNGLDQQSITVTLADSLSGQLVLTVTNDANSCTTTDTTFVLESGGVPIANIGADTVFVGCTGTVTLDGNSDPEDNISYEWVDPFGTPIFTETIEVSMPGTYTYTATNTLTNCVSTDQVVIETNEDFPIVMIDGGDGEFTCDPATDTLSITATLDNVSNFSFAWEASNGGQFASGTSTLLTPQVIAPGTYTITVTNQLNGCETVEEVIIAENIVEPTVVPFPEETALINCANPTLTLDGEGSSEGMNFVYTWTAPDGTTSDGTVEASELGFYSLEIFDTNNGCSAIDSVLVDTNFVTPILTVAEPPAISCSADSVILVAAVEDLVGTLNIEWTGGPGAIMNADQLEATVLQEGTYTVTVILEESGCSATETVTVTTDDTVPVAEAGEDLLLTCAVNEVSLDGTSSSTGDRFVYEWTTVDGALPPNVDTIESFTSTPAVYFLTVTDTILGCSATDSVLVDLNNELPAVSIGADGVITCENLEHVFNTSQTDTENVTYQWVEIINGTPETIPGATELDLVFDQEGSFALVVTNTETGCVGTDFGEVTDIRTDDPVVSFASTLENIDCVIEEVTFNASIAPDTVDYTYQWFDAATDMPIDGETDTTLTIGTPGDYYIIATNVENQCAVDAGVAIVTVGDDQDLPTINFAQDTFNITCLVDSVGIETTGTSLGDQFTYVWNQVGGDAIIPEIATGLEFGAPFVGAFEFVVTNTANGCISVDTAYIDTNYVAPTPIIDPVSEVFFCQTETISLNGANSIAEGANPSYEWFSLGAEDIISIGTGLTADILGPGGYQLTIITNPDIESCRSFTTVQVEGQLEAPEVMIMPVDSFDCFTQEITVSATATANETFTSVWKDLETGGILGVDVDEISVADTGFICVTYTTNINLDECTSIDTLEIGISAEEPILEFGQIDTITCVVPGVPVTITNIDAGIISSTVWDGPMVGTSDDVMATIEECGMYSATTTIINNIIGDCEASAEFVVECDTISPEIMQEEIEDLTCINESETLDISNSTSQDGATIVWMELSDFNDQTAAEATEPGDYTVTVTNPNGCEDSVVFSLGEDVTPPTILFEATEDFNCSGDPVALDASNSGAASDFSSILWTEVNGGAAPTPNNTLVTDAPAAGEYQLVLVNALNGCSDSTSVVVEEDIDAPIAAADTNMDPEDNNIGCDGSALSVGGTSTSTGPEFSYLWTVLSGSGTIADPTNAQTTVDNEGSYILTVLNEANECTTSDTIFVTAEVDLDLAELGQDTTICEMEYVLSANLPAGATGTWTSASGDIIDPADPNTTVMDLQTGDNVFTWTLTAPGCPDYSTASVVISVPDAPTANNDIVEIDETEEAEAIMAINNDLIQSSNFSFNVTTDPTRGQIDSIDAATGTIYYSIKPGEFGATTIVYKICDEDCETLCDEATIEINIVRREVEFNIANGITMNNDGVNDALIFDQLLNNPDAFEDNELIIFNRWGDIVFQAAPYNNDWTGVNENGEELPEGTYYYILRLSIPQGEIIRGDVTIVK